jgi:hypothetical protein
MKLLYHTSSKDRMLIVQLTYQADKLYCTLIVPLNSCWDVTTIDSYEVIRRKVRMLANYDQMNTNYSRVLF